MNVDQILNSLNQRGVRYLLIGGMNFMLRHQPILTYDVDIWIRDTTENRRRCESALSEISAEWGATEASWGPVTNLLPGWLDAQKVLCLTSPYGAIDIFRSVEGLDEWQSCWEHGVDGSTASGVSFRGLSDEDMLRCQLALTFGLQKQERIRALREAIKRRENPDD